MNDIYLSDDAMRWSPDGLVDSCCEHEHDGTMCPPNGEPCGDYRCCHP